MRGEFVSESAARLSRKFAAGETHIDKAIFKLLDASFARPFVAFLERRMLPGIQLHYAVRKLYIEDLTCRLLTADTKQVVIIGSGFDTLAFRLHQEFPNVAFIELDSVRMIEAKRRVLDAAAENLFFIPTNLASENLRDALKDCAAFDETARTLFIAEGVLMYLTAPQIADLFGQIKRSGGCGSGFIWTFMEQRSDGRIKFRGANRLIDFWLKRRGEVFKSSLAVDAVKDFLAAHDFTLRSLVGASELRALYLTASHTERLALAEGEYICHAESN